MRRLTERSVERYLLAGVCLQENVHKLAHRATFDQVSKHRKRSHFHFTFPCPGGRDPSPSSALVKVAISIGLL